MYRAKITEGNTFDIEVSGGQYTLNGETIDFDCSSIGNNKFHIVIDNASFRADLVRMDKSKSSFVFLVDGIEIELELEDQFDLLLDKLGMEKGAGANVMNIQAPMPGLVLQVHVKDGDEVKEGTPLLVLEAMKMENVIKAPKDVLIGTVDVKVGDKVDKGAILVHFDN